MKSLLKATVIGTIVLAVGAMAAYPTASEWLDRFKVKYRYEAVSQGDITFVINSTGEVKPVLSVAVGSFVSGPILRLLADFNDHVTKGQLLAEIDPRIYEAAVQRDRAALLTRKADAERAEALLQQAINDERRARALREKNEDFISQTEIDRFHFTRLSLAAQLDVAKAAIEQAEATLENSEANLNYTKIQSPVDGIVIDRKVDEGQTLAASFEAPELFTIAPEMDKKMHVFASVDEADIGYIRRSQENKQPVYFTVDAYPDQLFEGTIEQIRFSADTEENVVTYPVVVATPNEQLLLMPGMTAHLSFQVEKTENAIRIPNPALRFFPGDVKNVHPDYRHLVDGKRDDSDEINEDDQSSAMQNAEAARRRNRRHVWIERDGLLHAVEVVTGIQDNKYTELVSGELQVGDQLVTGIRK